MKEQLKKLQVIESRAMDICNSIDVNCIDSEEKYNELAKLAGDIGCIINEIELATYPSSKSEDIHLRGLWIKEVHVEKIKASVDFSEQVQIEFVEQIMELYNADEMLAWAIFKDVWKEEGTFKKWLDKQ